MESQGSLCLSLKGGDFLDITGRRLVEALLQAATFIPDTVQLWSLGGGVLPPVSRTTWNMMFCDCLCWVLVRRTLQASGVSHIPNPDTPDVKDSADPRDLHPNRMCDMRLEGKDGFNPAHVKTVDL